MDLTAAVGVNIQPYNGENIHPSRGSIRGLVRVYDVLVTWWGSIDTILGIRP
jgi:hypothetical protein